MPTLSAEYLDDLARVKLEAGDLDPGVVYSIERSTDGGTTWQAVRGATNITDGGVTIVYDYEYAPNIENLYRLTAPAISDGFARVVPPAGLVVDGQDGSYASTPDNPTLDITGDIDIRVGVWRDDWSAPAIEETMAAKYNDSTDDRSWRFTYLDDGRLRFQWTTDGTSGTIETELSSLLVPDVFGTEAQFIAFRVTRDASTGDVTFSYSSSFQDVGDDFEQFGTVQPGATGAMFSGDADLEVGARDNGTQTVWNGRIIGLVVVDGIGGFGDLEVNFAKQPTGTTAFNDDTSFPWTVNGTAAIAGQDQAWGSADTGQLWHEHDSPNRFPDGIWWVETGAGRVHNPFNSFSAYSRYIDVDLTDVEVRYDFYMPTIEPVANDEALFELAMRGTTSSIFDGYRVELFVESSTKSATLQIFTDPGSTDAVALPSWQPGQQWRVRARVVGTVIEAKAWNTSNPEPNTWQVVATSTNYASGNIGLGTSGLTNDEYETVYDNFLVVTVPAAAAATAAVTPTQDDVWLKSIAFPSLNHNLGCIQTTARTRRSRVGLFDIKGRHPPIGIADVGSTETFTILFDTHSPEENTAVTGLITFGAPLLLQSPPDADETGCGNIAAYPNGWFMPGDSTQVRPLLGKRVWEWQIPLTRVAAPDPQAVLPAHMTWSVLWQMVNTWVEVWDEWATWAELWNASVAPSAMFNALSGGETP